MVSPPSRWLRERRPRGIRSEMAGSEAKGDELSGASVSSSRLELATGPSALVAAAGRVARRRRADVDERGGLGRDLSRSLSLALSSSEDSPVVVSGASGTDPAGSVRCCLEGEVPVFRFRARSPELSSRRSSFPRSVESSEAGGAMAQRFSSAAVLMGDKGSEATDLPGLPRFCLAENQNVSCCALGIARGRAEDHLSQKTHVWSQACVRHSGLRGRRECSGRARPISRFRMLPRRLLPSHRPKGRSGGTGTPRAA